MHTFEAVFQGAMGHYMISLFFPYHPVRTRARAPRSVPRLDLRVGVLFWRPRARAQVLHSALGFFTSTYACATVGHAETAGRARAASRAGWRVAQ